MLALNLGYSFALSTEIDDLNSIVLLPHGNYSDRFSSTPELSRVFLDPQIYLSCLSYDSCNTTCSRLSTYPWFQVNSIPTREEGESKNDWQKRIKEHAKTGWKGQLPDDVTKACKDAIEYQIKIKCSHIILPSPLITEREDEAAIQAAWLDEGLSVVSEVEPTQPILATVAVDEQVLTDNCFETGGFLDTIVDQVTAREGVDGVYLVVCQTHKSHPYLTKKIVNKCYLFLTKKFHEAGYESIVVNFADVFGVTCLAAGASVVATGPSQALRRLSLKGFEDSSGGRSLPHYFSKKTICEYLSEADLDKIVDKKLLRRIEDKSPYAANLNEAMKNNRKAATVPDWAESQNNTTAAFRHFIHSLNVWIKTVKGSEDRKLIIDEWLEDADMFQTFINNKTGSDPDKNAPVSDWLKIFRENLL